MGKNSYRAEYDSFGKISIPSEAYYGAQTERARRNIQISHFLFPPVFIKALGLIKWASVESNMFLGELDKKRGRAISRAAMEVFDGKMDSHFILDVFQTGSGTSTNMNANEIIANRACELLGGKRGDKSLIHPNDHVNKGQSSNDVIPTAIHVAVLYSVFDFLLPALKKLYKELTNKSIEFKKVVKSGRTHLQDATPITLGQEFGGYATLIKRSIANIENAIEGMREVALGGTAVGTGINTHPSFAKIAIDKMNKKTGFVLYEAVDHFEAQSAKHAIVNFSGALKGTAVNLIKIANDIRWMASGPMAGLGEIQLPELQPGSSIMPGKVNPVIPEVVMQVSVQVIGNDSVITTAGFSGNFELNVMMPLIAKNILESIEILGRASDVFSEKCISGIKANADKCMDNAGKSLALVTPLAKRIGYDEASEIAKEAYKTGKKIRDIVLEKGLMTVVELNDLLDPEKMTQNDG